ncbi:MAG TPA: 50S ribosomal protein L23 [Candidatus Bathyarchaeia archaeon]|nr:50S ribosomal protein L23 [Candidatus Bathyarchaeia archaeon]
MNLKTVLKRPIITEKSMKEASFGRYAFEIDKQATKIDARKAVTKSFGVHPVSVKVVNTKGKLRWARGLHRKTATPNRKKAIVTLKEGEKIDIFEAGE